MKDPDHLPKSPLMMSRGTAAVLVVDTQQRLIELVPSSDQVTWNIRRILDAAKILDIPSAGTEQYPEKLGGMADMLTQRLGEVKGKRRFSCGEHPGIFQRFSESNRHQILVVGIETHVCIMQTVLDLIAEQFDVHVAVDAVSARNKIDHDTALRRMQLSGATLTTTETAIFEWCESSTAPEFKEISAIVREKPDVGKRLGFA